MMKSELLPFLRCQVEPATTSPDCVISFRLADKTWASAMIHKDLLYDKSKAFPNGRLCKVKLHLLGSGKAVIILPAPILGKGCSVEVSKDSLEWHR
ncbi:MAG: hypothetical protein Q8P76_02175 [bacterium]|nr:hypothetical protein [bacterium]